MEWYEILIALFFICILFGSLVMCCIFDYKYKLKKLEFDNKKEKDLKNTLDQISFSLNEINNNIYIKNKKE